MSDNSYDPWLLIPKGQRKVIWETNKNPETKMCFMETFVAPIIETNSKSLGPAIWLFSTLSNSDPECSSTHSSTKSIKSEKKEYTLFKLLRSLKWYLTVVGYEPSIPKSYSFCQKTFLISLSWCSQPAFWGRCSAVSSLSSQWSFPLKAALLTCTHHKSSSWWGCCWILKSNK